MKTVITDNSLCTLPLDESARPEHIYKYIAALGEMGVKYVELDFRAVMKMRELPDGIGYIFRLGDPTFAGMASAFDFRYVLVTVNDLKSRVRVNSPVIMEFPALNSVTPQLLRLSQAQISGRISMLRLRGSYPMMSREEVARMIWNSRNTVTIPVDICPMNSKKTALDMAVKSALASADSLTLCMGLPRSYASIEEFLFALMTVYEIFPEEYDMTAMCKAAVYHRMIFGKYSADSLSHIMQLLDNDIAGLRNADTGQRVHMKITLKDKMMLHRTYVSALEKLADSEDIPDDIAYDIYDAVKKYDASLFDTELMYGSGGKLLN